MNVFAREPIFTVKKDIFAYQFIYRNGLNGSFPLDLSIDTVAGEPVSGLNIDDLMQVNMTIINLLPEALSELSEIFSPNDVMVEISELHNEPPAGLLTQIAYLKTKGFKLVANQHQLKWPEFMAHVNYLKLNIMDNTPADIAQHKENLAGTGIKLIATNVHSKFQFEQCQDLQVDYLQGFFFLDKDKIDTKWLFYELVRANLNQYATGQAQPGLSVSNLEKVKITVPKEEAEQQKIAATLTSLDHLIAAENEKLKVLQAHKKGLLQQLFPVKGEKVPKVRFGEFSGEWEETTLTQVADYENGKAHEKEISETGKYKVVNSKFISTNGEVVKFTNAANLKSNFGDILMVLSDIPNGKAIAKCFYVNKDDTYTVNQRICRITATNIDSRFLYYVLNRNHYFLSFDDGVKQTNLRKDTVLNCPLLKPTNPREQEKIAYCIESISSKIVYQSENIESLKEHKKGLMQQMFPSIV